MTEQATKQRKPWFSFLLWGLFVLMLFAYSFRPSWAYAITLYPAWTWSSLLLIVHLLSVLKRRKLWLSIGAAWLLFALAFSEETRTMFRSGPAKVDAYKIISVNCAGGDPNVAEEALVQKPDLVLLQESPGSTELEKLASTHGYSLVRGPDGSIMARGQLREIPRPPAAHNFVLGIWTPPGATREYLVTSLRLQPPLFRLDYWSPDLWKSYAANKDARKQELADIVWFILEHRNKMPLIVGGDFNTPPDKVIQAPLISVASDAFSNSGRGWPGTAVNDYPLVRIDQVWLSEDLKPLDSLVKKTAHSDHRMVVVWMSRK